MASNDPHPADRAARIRRVIEDVVRRRASGEQLGDAQIIAANPDLLPELQVELTNLEKHLDGLRGLVSPPAANEKKPEDESTQTDSGAGEAAVAGGAAGNGANAGNGAGGAARDPAAKRPGAPRLAKDAFPGYEIVRSIDAGGQGAVFQAIQKGTNRKVAIKVLIDGVYASTAARRRFEREIELVAQLKHPNIISIFHSGETADGRQYYVMDYVRGKPLNQYVREKKLTLEETIRIFVSICRAVEHAHRRGIVHRDLKPSNVLVSDILHQPANAAAQVVTEPRVLDFGLAKQLTGPVDCITSHSADIIGTLAYMSPEQASGDAGAIDTRTDVYSLGVMLFELVTGDFPYPVKGRVPEVIQNIVEGDLASPRIAWRQQSGVRSSAHPSQCPVDFELETILRKCLATSPVRRYANAGEIADELDRYLNGEPIAARRDSATYLVKKRLSRLIGRNPVAVSTLIAISVVFIVQTVGVWVVFSATPLDRWVRGLLVDRSTDDNWKSVRMVEIQDDDDLTDVANGLGIHGYDRMVKQSRRIFHGRLLAALARARARVVAHAIEFNEPSVDARFDDCFLEGLRAVKAAGIDWVVGVSEWHRLEGAAVAERFRTFAVPGAMRMNAPPLDNWAVDLADRNERGTCFPSLSLAAFAFAVKPQTTLGVQLQPEENTMELSFSEVDDGRGGISRVIWRECVMPSAYNTPDRAQLIILLPNDDIIKQNTVSLRQALEMSEEERLAFFENKAVLVGDNDVTRDTPDGRHIPLYVAHAASIEALLSKRSLQLPSAGIATLIIAAAATIGVIVGNIPRTGPMLATLMLGVCITLLVTLLCVSVHRVFINPVLPLLSLGTAAIATPYLLRRVPRATPS